MSIGLGALSKQTKRHKKRKKIDLSVWPKEYKHRDTGKVYTPHNEDEETFVYDRERYRHLLLKAGEGAGKSVAGIIKTLDNLRLGMNGIMGAPDLQHFKRSLWPEFRNWCPQAVIVNNQRYRLKDTWTPSVGFELLFKNQMGGVSRLMCGGFKEELMGAWEGPNVAFVFFDEARRHKTPIALKTLDGRIRIPGPNNEVPQFYLTSTPKMHWLFDYFGPLQPNDPFERFKEKAFTGTISTELNRDNLAEGYVEDRINTLDANESKILVKGEWAEESNKEKFINMGWWDACRGQISPVYYPCVIALDASKGSEDSMPDTFSLVMTSRRTDESHMVDVRYVETWQPDVGEQFYYGPVEETIKRLCANYPVVEIAYDPYQLHHFALTLGRKGIAYFREFTQQKQRFEADKQLLDLILERNLVHDGNETLRTHIDNADVKKYADDGNKVRIIKRYRSLKVDAAVALSMAANRTLYYSAV